MNKLKVGDKVIVIRSRAGNEGKIAEVIDFCPSGVYQGFSYGDDADTVVKSLGSCFRTSKGDQHIVGVIPHDWLRKLPDVKEDMPMLMEKVK